MSAVAFRLRSEFRRRWRAWVGIALLIGLGGGIALALAQGARRTRGAYPRFASAQHGADVVVTGQSSFGLVGGVDLDQVARIPEVTATARAFVAVPFVGTVNGSRAVNYSDIFPVAGLDGALGTTIERWKLQHGRRPDPARVDEAVASFELADRMHLHVGDTVAFHFYRAADFGATAARLAVAWPARLAGRHDVASPPSAGADGPRVQVHIVGIEASPAEFPPLTTDLAPVLHMTPAFAARYHGTVVGSDLAYLRLRSARDLSGFQQHLERLSGGRPVALIETRPSQTEKVQRGIDVEANVLTIVAVVVALAVALVAAQAFARQAYADRVDDGTLRALGMDDGTLTATAIARAAVIAAGGAVIAGVTGTLLAPMVLLPLARQAALDTGPRVDWLVVGLGALAIFAVGIGAAWWTGRAGHRRAVAGRRGRAVGPGVTRPVSAGLGVRFALGRFDAPAVGAVLGIAAASAIFVGAFTFTGNLDRQLDNHRRYGWNWDQKIGAPGLPDASPVLAPALQHDRGITGLALGTVTSSRIGNERVDVFAIDQLKGAVWPTISAGHPPYDANEVVLGARTLRHVGARVGDTVRLTIGGRVATYRVVGRGVFPEFGDAGQLGTGALMTFEGVQRILPTAPRNTYLVRYARPADIGHEQRLVAAAVVPYPTRQDARPQDLVDLARGDGLLGFLAIALALLALGVLVHALLTAARSSRHDFAVVRALGLARGQVRSVVGWQAVCVMAGAVLVGVPLGLIGGQLAWRQFATSLGVVPDAVIPPGTVLLTLAGAAVIGVAATWFPAVWAARGRPAPALRTA